LTAKFDRNIIPLRVIRIDTYIDNNICIILAKQNKKQIIQIRQENRYTQQEDVDTITRTKNIRYPVIINNNSNDDNKTF
jgi:hypothetical protein